MRPMVRKNSEINWKQSSKTLSTAARKFSHHPVHPVRVPPAAFTFDTNSRTSVLLQWLAMLFSDDIQEMHLLDHVVVERDDILGLDVGRLVLLEQRQSISEVEHAIKDGLLLGVQRSPKSRRVSHGGVCESGRLSKWDVSKRSWDLDCVHSDRTVGTL